MSNRAAYLTAKQAKPLEVDNAPRREPGTDEVLIKNHAVAVNPVDWKIQVEGYFVQNYPFILGTDVAGIVEEVGDNVTNVKKGDRVLGHCISLDNQDNAYSAFQQYSLVPAVTVAAIPDSLSFVDASVLPLAISTAATGLYPKEVLGLPYPTTSSVSSQNSKTIVVIGGSSSVGTVAIQLACASGLEVISTASPQNHGYVKSLGATQVYDHKDPEVAGKIASHIAASHTPFAGIYDAISLENTFQLSLSLAKKVNGNFRVATTLPAPENIQSEAKGLGVTFHGVIAFHIYKRFKDMSEEIWCKFVPEALKSGSLKPLPEPLVVGRGLEKVQDGLDKSKEGVSARKIIVEL